jgi:hypothetical protein
MVIKMSLWMTSSGILANLDRGESACIALQYNMFDPFTNFNIISGNLPDGINISNSKNDPYLALPSIYGTVSASSNSGLYSFTVRANSNIGIDDRTFSINVNDDEIAHVFPNSNIGIFPDGRWMFANVAPLSHMNCNINLVSGNLPGNIKLDPDGIISGYINPNNLYTTPTANGFNSANTKLFSFTVGYDSNITANYSMTIMRADLFANSNANVLGSVYHAPIFSDAKFFQNSNTANINLGIIAGDNVYYKFVSEDFENDTVKYQLINGNIVPGNISLNSNTGWLTGFIDEDKDGQYSFEVRAFKEITEPVTGTNPYQTIMPITLTVCPLSERNIQWLTDSNLGNIVAGIPSSLRINTSIIDSIALHQPINPTAQATMKLVGVQIINGGGNFSIGKCFNVVGGISANSANIIISNVSANAGSITEVEIVGGIQRYTTLPILNNILLENANGYNALFNLDFGIEDINIINKGKFCDSVTVGFSDAGESSSAKAIATIFNDSISGVTVTDTGNNYQIVPQVIINGLTTPPPVNPISYSISSGLLPNGLKLLSNGMLVGVASSNTYAQFNFTISAIAGSNKPINTNGNIEDYQTLIQDSKDFSLNVIPSESPLPETNLFLEFLLSDEDRNALVKPLHNQSIISNTDIYRESDFYFGIQNNIRMLMAYGIQSSLIDSAISALAKYHYKKTFLLTDLKWAQSTSENYEVIYIQPKDEYTDDNGNTYSGSIVVPICQPEITVDSSLYMADSYLYRASDNNQLELYPATIPNMINQITSNLSAMNEKFLPSWMTDVQPDNNVIGFVPVIPLVYVKSGCGKRVLFYLQQYYDNIGPKLNTIKAQTDRYIWNYGYIENGEDFLYEDENSIYLKFNNSLLKQSIVGV